MQFQLTTLTRLTNSKTVRKNNFKKQDQETSQLIGYTNFSATQDELAHALFQSDHFPSLSSKETFHIPR